MVGAIVGRGYAGAAARRRWSTTAYPLAVLRSLQVEGSSTLVFGEIWGDAPVPVVALHGWRRTHSDFSGVLGPTSGARALGTLAPDLPGFGASPAPPEAWGSQQYAQLLAPIIKELADPPVVVLGHSFGGRVAVQLAAHHRELVRGLVLTGSPLAPRPGRQVRPALGFRAIRAARRWRLVSEARLEAARQRYGSEDYRLAQGVMREVLVRLLQESYDEALEKVGASRCPVELVWADNDTAAPLAVAHALRDRLLGAGARSGDVTLTVCPGVGHLTPLSAPEPLRQAVERLIDDGRGPL